jgi:hypothetical protein
VGELDDRKILMPFDKRDCIRSKEAAAIANTSESTMRTWTMNTGCVGESRADHGRQQDTLTMHLDYDRKALRADHTGDRTAHGCAARKRERTSFPPVATLGWDAFQHSHHVVP